MEQDYQHYVTYLGIACVVLALISRGQALKESQYCPKASEGLTYMANSKMLKP